MMPEQYEKRSYRCDDLVRIIEILRSPEGCPWDRAQDHHSIRNNFLEEAYEAVEAIDREDTALLCEELGDVLLQIVLHTQMEAERGHFDFGDVCTGICCKMIGRHPHVFGGEQAADAEAAAQSWEEQKRREKGLYSLEDRLRQVSMALPALMRAQKLTVRASTAGCDVEPDNEEIRAAMEQALNGGEAEASQRWGRLLFMLCERMSQCGVAAEEALSNESDRMIIRFLEMQHSEAPDGDHTL
mgnify:FL=1